MFWRTSSAPTSSAVTMWLRTRSAPQRASVTYLKSKRNCHPSETAFRNMSSGATANIDPAGDRRGKSRLLITQALFENESGKADLKRDTNPCLKCRPYALFMDEKRSEAKRSLFVQVKSKESAEDLYLYCSSEIGKVKSMHYHTNRSSTDFPNFFIVEFESRDGVLSAFERCRHNSDPGMNSTVPVTSPFLWFGQGQLSKAEVSALPIYLPIHADPILDEKEIQSRVAEASGLSKQMVSLFEHTRMSDVSYRIRFLACEQIELALSGMFPKAQVLPFGSSVNSFGKNSSDLDMSVVLHEGGEESSLARLVFQAKGNRSGNHRGQSQRYCDRFAHLIQTFLPGCQEVQTILHARVPIVKFRHQLLGLECDLSTTQSGYFMSELLYLYGELDDRVKPLVFTVRQWARLQNLNEQARPTSLFTNFTLSLMVIFFLQHRYKMLPPFHKLQVLAGSRDHYICDDKVDCSFLRDISGLQPTLNACFGQPLPSGGDLLAEFFKFYSEFDFGSTSICVVSGLPQKKQNPMQPIDITNPLELDRNVSANVDGNAVTCFKMRCKESLERALRELNRPEGQQSLARILASSGEAPSLDASSGLPTDRIVLNIQDLFAATATATGKEGKSQRNEKSKAVNKPVKSGSYFTTEKQRRERQKRQLLKASDYFEPKF